MTRLVNVAELETADTAGWRLQRLEIYNWGTFDQKVWTFDTRGENALLTGDIGSGKSTIVDAITTLLLPANRISYNKAAGAEVKERSLRSYVLGYHKSERNEETGASRPVALRDRRSFSAILGVFANAGFGSTVSLAQIFWFGSNHNQPDRCYIIADKELAIAADFTDFGGDIAALKRRLRHSGARVHDHFPPYGKDFRRQLGIESDQAMELFHQTVSMKSVGNLNDFVRNHMLEPFDADVWTKGLVDHFEDLTRAHDAVRKARDQLTELEPLLAECDAHGRVASEIASLKRQRDALRFYCADRKARLLTDQVGMLIGEVESYQDKLVVTKDRLRDLRIRKEQLALRRVGLGGNRLAEIDRLVDDARACFTEMTVRTNEFAGSVPDVPTVFVVENEVTYLAFPPVARSILIFGGGYALSRLEPLSWLADKELIYWGDIDTHGFTMLNRLRRRFGHVRSMLMDRVTLLAHETQWVREPSPVNSYLELLTTDEAALYTDLVENALGEAVRLEQERVSFGAIDRALRSS